MLKLTAGRVLILALLVGLPGALALSVTAQGSGVAANVGQEPGHADFLTYCAACHGVGAKGDGTVAEFLTINAADLTQLKKKNGGTFPREHIFDVIDGRAAVKTHGPRDMPVWGDWFMFEAGSSVLGKGAQEDVIRARIDALVGYIATIQED